MVSQGLAATTTRQIAEHVGIRQASLYYYFASKDEILLELLTQSLRSSLKIAKILEARSGGRDDPAADLYALALIDVQTLTRAPHNIAALYLLPEVQGDDYASFRAERAELQAAYGRLGKAASAVPSLDLTLTAALIMQLVESVIHLRRTKETSECLRPRDCRGMPSLGRPDARAGLARSACCRQAARRAHVPQIRLSPCRCS